MTGVDVGDGTLPFNSPSLKVDVSMTNFQPIRTTYGDGPWEGAAKWVRVKDRDEIGKVVDPGKNLGFESCYGILFESSGQVCYYRKKDVERCDESGNTRST